MGQDELNSFLSVAEDLKIKGLTQGTQTSNTNNNPQHAPFIPPHVPSPSPLKRKVSSPLPPLKQMQEPYYIPTTPPPPKKKAKLASRPPPTPPPTVSSPKIEDSSALTVDSSSDQLQIEENSNLTIDSDNHIEIDDSQQTNDEDIENIDESIVTDEGEYESATVDAAHIVEPAPPPGRNKGKDLECFFPPSLFFSLKKDFLRSLMNKSCLLSMSRCSSGVFVQYEF